MRNFVSVFHGIRFKVKRLFVAMTSNFFYARPLTCLDDLYIMQNALKKIELLAPARNADIAVEAIKHGADAVYIGAEGFGARAAAGNAVADIERLTDYAHRYLARVYVTVNTIIYDNELREVERLIKRLYHAGVDALIVQDMAVLRMDIPPIALHASTQCDTRTPDRARFLQDAGFSQIVLPRELSLDEIRAMRAAVDVPLEAFVHGALCVSYSGDCHASHVLKGRSANRGECDQICRLTYDLYDGAGNCVERGRHFLSLRDMNRSAELLSMLEAGVTSFKIEGRLKDAGYVKNVVSYYDRKLRGIVENNPDIYCRESVGRTVTTFIPELQKSFNRGFTTYFLNGDSGRVGSIYTPKSQGEPVGSVVRCHDRMIEARLDTALANGDGLGYFNERHEFVGFRLNRVEGSRLYPASSVNAAPGTRLYRNSDKAFDDLLKKESATRSVIVDMTLRMSGTLLAVDAEDERGNAVTATVEVGTPDRAQTDQTAQRRKALGKLGGTGYSLGSLDDRVGNLFLPAAVLTSLRRDVTSLLDSANRMRYCRELRRQENAASVYPDRQLDYHSNVANALASEFYRSHGVKTIMPSLETSDGAGGAKTLRVMTTRYCLRRELGACLKKGGADKIKGPLTLRSGDMTLRLDFDCAACRMLVNTTKRS